MLATTVTVGCPSCKSGHDLFLANADMANSARRYEFTCPRTHASVPVVLPDSEWWQTVQARPKGAVDVREVPNG